MIGLGTTLRCNLPPRHIWVVLSDPLQTDDQILLVNMTTLADDCIDDSCILTPADYPLLTHETASGVVTCGGAESCGGKMQKCALAVKLSEDKLTPAWSGRPDQSRRPFLH